MFDFSKEQLMQNRKDRLNASRDSTDYKGDLILTTNGKINTISIGKLALDGAGNIRAYNYFIRCNQHCCVVYSLVVMNYFYVIGY